MIKVWRKMKSNMEVKEVLVVVVVVVVVVTANSLCLCSSHIYGFGSS